MKPLALAAAGTLAMALLASAAGVNRMERWTPAVLSRATSGSVLWEAAVTPAVVSADITLAGTTTPRALRDDGQLGDRVAGDRTFSLRIPADELRARYDAAHAAKRHPTLSVGTARFFDASGALLQTLSVVMPVLHDAIPLVAVRSAGDVQYTPHLVNVRMPLDYFLKQDLGDFEIEQVTRIFYQHFKDSFDVINVVFSATLRPLRHWVPAQNSVQGIGLAPLTLLPKWGSAGQLQGLFVAPNGAVFDITQSCAVAYLHEHGHRWINFLEGGMKDPRGHHWPLGDLAGGIMGYSAPAPNGPGVPASGQTVLEGNDLRFRPFAECPRFDPLELYLMGLRASTQVGSHLVAVDQAQNPGLTIAGPFTAVPMQDVLANNGPRVPAFPSAQRVFRVATVLVTPDNLASEEEMAWYESEALYIESAFHHATGGAGRMLSEVDTFLIGPPPFAASTIHRVRNAASLASGPVASGEIIRIDGLGLGPVDRFEARLLGGTTAPVELAGISVLVNGTAIPLLSVQASQIVAVVPALARVSLTGAEFQVRKTVNGITTLSNAVQMETTPVSPAIFTSSGLGSGEAIMTRPDGTPVTVLNPAAPGSEVVIVAQGLGPFVNAQPNGSLIGPAPPEGLVNAISVVVDGKPATDVRAAGIEGEVSNKVAIRFRLPSQIFGSVVQTQPFVFVVVRGQASQPGVRINVRLL